MLPWHMCEDQRTTCRSQYSPSPMCVLGVELRSWGLAASSLSCWAFSTAWFFAFLKTALETTNCNLVADILRTAKEVKSTEQFWEESLINIPIFHARLGESRWLRTELFLELKSALVETYALSAHATVPPQTSSTLSFRFYHTDFSK